MTTAMAFLQQRSGYRADLQGLRALAIVLVVLCHSGVPAFAGGFVGVDVFFVLSGYLITRLLLWEWRETGRIALPAFYARRLRRLLPAMVIMLIAAGGAAVALLSTGEAIQQLASAPYAATWTSNLYFAFSRLGYFDEPAARDVFLHTWSLSVEEQFYLAWAPALALMLAMSRTARPERLGVALGLIFIGGFAASVHWTAVAPTAAYYLMPSRIWQFALGGLLCCFPASQSFKGGGWMLMTGTALILGTATQLASEVPYPGVWALLPSMGTALVILAGSCRAGVAWNPLTHPLMVWLGDRSYSWYLWHWPVLVLGSSLGFAGEIVRAELVLLSLLFATLSYEFVELPFWKGRYRVGPPRLTLLASCLVVTSTAAICLHTLRPQAPRPDGIDVWRFDAPIIYSMGCDSSFTSAEVKPCIFGSDDAENTVVLIGDSIGAQWFSAIRAIFPEPGWRMIVLTKSACAMVDEDYYYARIKSQYDACTKWRNKVLDGVAAFDPDLVIMGSSAGYDFTEEQWVEGSARIFKRLSGTAPVTFVIAGTPKLGFSGPGCVARHAKTPERAVVECVEDNGTVYSEPVALYLTEAARSFPNVHVLDFTDIVCPDGLCRALSNTDGLVFRDNQHLTDSFVRRQTSRIREYFAASLPSGAPASNASQRAARHRH